MSPPNPSFTRSHFGPDFHWGVSTAAYQIEGAHDLDGKGLSIWDVFVAKKGKIKGGHHAETSCNFYHNYADDIALVGHMNLPNFRFSISWSRLMPTGKLPFNPKGIDYYNRVIDALLDAKIEPWITLYHWDLPYELEKKGGWTNREIIHWFSDYVTLCVQHFGGRVKNWMVMNEPSVFTGAGYFLGIHAPGKRGLSNYLKAMHHATLATVTGAKILRNHSSDLNIGTTFSCTHIEAFSDREKDVKAAQRVDTLLNRAFIEPLLGLGYPQNDLSLLKRLDRIMRPEDVQNLTFDFDFIGLQCYTREIIQASMLTPYIGAKVVKASKRNVALTDMNWEVYPPSIYYLLKKLSRYKNIPKIIVTENGAAFPDVVKNGEVNDPKRTQYLQDHLEQLLKAKNEGVQVEGYFVWTLTDNFEWAEGYHPRFGLVHVDFETQKRTIKQSGKWLQSFLKPYEK